jgi:PadR family transcriptional regulator PadR
VNILNQQLKKGVLEIVVLKIISEEDVYGYDLIKKMEQESDGYYTIKEGSLYPILYRLEDKNYIQSYSKAFDGERRVPRKYYKITDAGTNALYELIEEWHAFKKITSIMLD